MYTVFQTKVALLVTHQTTNFRKIWRATS